MTIHSLSLLGKLIIGTTKGFIRGNALSVEGHTHNYAASSHTHTTSSITSGSFSVSRGGTGRSTLTSGYFLRGNGTSAVTLSSIDQVKTALGISSSSYSIIFGSYVGDGRYGTDQYITIALEIVPYLILVKRLNATSYINSFSESFLWLYNETTLLMSSYGSISCELDQTTFKWSGSGQSTSSKFDASTVFNASGVTYQYIAFGT